MIIVCKYLDREQIFNEWSLQSSREACNKMQWLEAEVIQIQTGNEDLKKKKKPVRVINMETIYQGLRWILHH